jgi:hypothetical protein
MGNKNKTTSTGVALKKWLDISDETQRRYIFIENGDKYILAIPDPQKLMISDDGSHRVKSGGTTQYYVRPGWKWLEWDGNYSF